MDYEDPGDDRDLFPSWSSSGDESNSQQMEPCVCWAPKEWTVPPEPDRGGPPQMRGNKQPEHRAAAGWGSDFRQAMACRGPTAWLEAFERMFCTKAMLPVLLIIAQRLVEADYLTKLTRNEKRRKSDLMAKLNDAVFPYHNEAFAYELCGLVLRNWTNKRGESRK